MRFMSVVGAAAVVGEDGGTLERLRSSSNRLAVLDEEYRAEQKRRDELIVQARDLGFSWRTLAGAARVSMSRCVAIVSGG